VKDTYEREEVIYILKRLHRRMQQRSLRILQTKRKDPKKKYDSTLISKSATWEEAAYLLAKEIIYLGGQINAR